MQTALLEFLGQGSERIETHAAYVFLHDDRAFKLKKAIKLPYLDFSTVSQRKATLDREYEINRAFAPSLYRGVRPVIEEEPGRFRIGGTGRIVDWLLEMQRFPDRSLLIDVIERGELDDALALALAEAVAHAHDKAPASDWDGVSIMAALEEQLFQAFDAELGIFPKLSFEEFCLAYAHQFRGAKPILVARSKNGLVRRCHGDLHCGNIVVLDGKPLLFDAIEFSERIATVDVLYDLAFLLMDLMRRDERRAAWLILNRYFELRRKQEDLSGLALMSLFFATRAGVRALVAVDKAKEMSGRDAESSRSEAQDYFAIAMSQLAPPPPRLIAIGGLSGTGKTALSRSLCPTLLPLPGALQIRSDVERKILLSVAETERLDSKSYTPEISAEVYEVMLARAAKALEASWSVILDAVHALPAERDRVEQLAVRLGVNFTGLWLDAPGTAMKSRVASRRGDASDATPAVVEKQMNYDTGEIHWHRIDASGSPAETLQRAMRVIESSSASTSAGVL